MRPALSYLFALSLLSSPAVFAGKPATPVFVTELERKSFAEQIEALGTLRARESVVLSSTVTDRIVTVNFEDGQRVRRGDVLVEMDAAEERALLEGERSVMAEAKREVERLTPLLKSGVASVAAMDQARRDLTTAQAGVAALRTQINERIIVAPFDGKLGLRNISVGAMAQPGTQITTIDDDSLMKLDFSVPELFLADIREGDTLQARARVFPDTVFEGKVSSLDSRINPVTRSIVVRALIDNPDRLLRPGMLMRVRLYKTPREVLLLPEESLLTRGDKHFVYRVEGAGADDDGLVARLREVAIGKRRQGEVEIVSGLEAGDRLVTHGTVRLSDGAAVVVKAVDASSESLAELLAQGKGKSDGKQSGQDSDESE